ncbi:MAG TPA: aldo/keto reductase [Candidatus Scybalocola faecigallinarum]|uniref:Aldo/keto reductase n=1 Tax=Candidatus Scybalocola faecigallinarum TaxID=2840941 RepID=A0A9D1F200_9FIRM|nr:aldo/keto reductase [Candidatus Scybalocola faecigallinarum]
MKKLGFGLMRLPQLDPDDYSSVDVEAVKRMADTFLKKGFTYFDTAAPYHGGNSEVAFREAVAKRYPRSAYTITDKLSLFMIKKPGDMSGFFQAQLERLGVEYIDYYLLHGLGEPSYRQAEEFHAFEFVRKLKDKGKVKHIGLSFHDKAELLDEILTRHPEMEYVQLQLNYLDWEDAAVQSRLCYETAVKHGKPVIVMEPIKGGSLVNIPEEAKKLFEDCHPELSVVSWAIRFAASPKNVMMVLSGMNSEEQLADNTSYMEQFRPLDEREKEVVEKATGIIKKSIAIPCTACRYCIDDCPKKIAIPDYFAIYNNVKRFGKEHSMADMTYFGNLTQTHGKPSDCIKCGKCEKRCPQHLPIRRYLEMAVQTLE